MGTPQLNYFYFELAFLGAAMSFAWDRKTTADARSLRFWRTAGLLFLAWFLVDQIAVRAGIWSFPRDGTLPVRIALLPLEEWLSLLGHTMLTYLVLRTTLRCETGR